MNPKSHLYALALFAALAPGKTAAMQPCGSPSLKVYKPIMWAPVADIRFHSSGFGLGTGILYAPTSHTECTTEGMSLDIEGHSKDGALISAGFSSFSTWGFRSGFRISRQIAPEPKYAAVATFGALLTAVSIGVERRTPDDMQIFLGLTIGGGFFGIVDHIVEDREGNPISQP